MPISTFSLKMSKAMMDLGNCCVFKKISWVAARSPFVKFHSRMNPSSPHEKSLWLSFSKKIDWMDPRWLPLILKRGNYRFAHC